MQVSWLSGVVRQVPETVPFGVWKEQVVFWDWFWQASMASWGGDCVFWLGEGGGSWFGGLVF